MILPLRWLIPASCTRMGFTAAALPIHRYSLFRRAPFWDAVGRVHCTAYYRCSVAGVICFYSATTAPPPAYRIHASTHLLFCRLPHTYFA